jgi:hypothetical protein
LYGRGPFNITARLSDGTLPESKEGIVMKKLIVSVFALTLLGATAASASVGVGVHVGGVGLGVGVGIHGHHHHTHCYWHHHHRICRRY